MTHATTTRADSSDRSMAERLRLRVHAIQTGRLRGNEAFLGNRGWSALLRRRVTFELPAFVYVIEHPDGHIAIDTGVSVRGWPTPGPVKRLLPSAAIEPDEEG